MSPKVRLAMRFIDGNLQRDIYVNDAAEEVGLSPSHFSHLFKAEMGMSFYRYLIKARLEKARNLLEESPMPVKLIAFEVGYKDPGHFEREFKKAYAVTPSQYRADYLCRIAI
ncbi:MAG TPA: AraC family transcriptional regulator [Blastocatellia bacterium]|jgi:AraC-like DNA-binding protein